MRRFARWSFLSLAVVVPSLVGCGAGTDKSGTQTSLGDPGSRADSGSAQADGGSTFDTGDLGEVGTFDLTIDPLNTVVYIDTGKTPVAPGSQTYTVTESGMDVSSGTTFTLDDPSVGTFAANV